MELTKEQYKKLEDLGFTDDMVEVVEQGGAPLETWEAEQGTATVGAANQEAVELGLVTGMKVKYLFRGEKGVGTMSLENSNSYIHLQNVVVHAPLKGFFGNSRNITVQSYTTGVSFMLRESN